MLAVLITLAIAPGLFLLWFFYYQDRYEPEPKMLVIKTFLLGTLMVFPAAYLEVRFGIIEFMGEMISGSAPITRLFMVAFFLVALVEELLKFLPAYLLSYRSPEFNEIMDGIVYSVSAHLGFATLENVFIVLQEGYTTALTRAVLIVPGHAFFGGVMGYYLGQAKFHKEHEKRLILKGLVLGIFFHGLYDFILFLKPETIVLVVPLILWLYFKVTKDIGEAVEKSPFKPE